ncbi:unnamed protein product, partial [marine sediment metagenome]
GWQCVSLEGHNAVLLSPDGIRRELDLRHDVETLRPNAAGDETNLTPSGAATNWECVDEAIPDEDTLVLTGSEILKRDLYNIANRSVGSGIINHITVYARCRYIIGVEGNFKVKVTIKSGTGAAAPDTVDEGDEETLIGSWKNHSHQWNTNPATSIAWTWDEIDNLQIGIGFRVLDAGIAQTCWCTQVYVEVDYTPSLSTNAATSINPASAILNGTLLDDLGEGWDVRFQWGRTEDYGNDTDWQDGGFTTGDTFSQLINTLEPGTLYHFRAQAKTLALGTVSGRDMAFWTLKPSVGKAYAFSRELHIKRATDVLDKASIAADAITTLADCKGLNLREVPSSLTLTVEATYAAAATQGIKIHVRTSLTDRAVGVHTGADGAAALTDAEAHFVADELVGLMIKNLTDGSSGAITANTETGVTATLVGGTNNDWDSGDAYVIEGAGYDTEDWDSFAPAFGAGSSIRQTEHYDVDP